MARYVKRKRRRIRPLVLATILFSFSFILMITTSLLINATNASLTMKIQSMQEEVDQLKSENSTLNYNIQNLENKERIYALAESNNMLQNEDNIIAIQGD